MFFVSGVQFHALIFFKRREEEMGTREKDRGMERM
jgi:hypothetical protein